MFESLKCKALNQRKKADSYRYLWLGTAFAVTVVMSIRTPVSFTPVREYRRVSTDFAISTRHAEKVLAIEIAGLGDLVHSLPALWALRQGYPNAELHCLVEQRNASLLQLTPWIDRVVPYRRRPSGGLGHHLSAARLLREARYDVAVDFIGANYSAVVAGISGASRRLIRRPGSSRPRWAWNWFNTDVMETPFRLEPMYLQRLNCLRQAGFFAPEAIFQLSDAVDVRAALEVAYAEVPSYVHVSPFTKLARRELPPQQMVLLLARLMQEHPQHRLVLSCSSKPRELAALGQLLSLMPTPPWKVFAGTLDIPALFSVIKSAALHIGGDTGTVHLAWLAGTPSVTWFRQHAGLAQWSPRGTQHVVITTPLDDPDYLQGIDNDILVGRVRSMLVGSSTAQPSPRIAVLSSAN